VARHRKARTEALVTVSAIELVEALLTEARDKTMKLHAKLVHENRKLVDQLADARDGIAERDARIRELEEALTNAHERRSA
jgi:hypothetical protein